MSDLIPGQALIYTRANGVIYANYRDPPHNSIPKWVIGGEPEAVAEAMGIVSYDKWKLIMLASEKHPVIKKQIERLLVLFDVIKDDIER